WCDQALSPAAEQLTKIEQKRFSRWLTQEPPLQRHTKFQTHFFSLDVVIVVVCGIQTDQFKPTRLIKTDSRVVATLRFQNQGALTTSFAHFNRFVDQNFANALITMVFIHPNVGDPQTIV